MAILIRPGQRSALVSLQSVLKERHDNVRAQKLKEIERRKENGVPLDDSVDWTAVQVATQAQDPAKLRALLGGDMLVDPGEYAPIPGLDAVMVKFVALSDEKREDLDLAVRIAAVERDKLLGQPLTEAGVRAKEAERAITAAQLEYIRAHVVELLDGEERLDLNNAEDVSAIRTSGLVLPLFYAARDYQDLSLGKEKRFGS